MERAIITGIERKFDEMKKYMVVLDYVKVYF